MQRSATRYLSECPLWMALAERQQREGVTAGRSAVRLTGRRRLPTSLELVQPLVHVYPSRSISAFTAASYGRLPPRQLSPRAASRCGRSSPAITSADDIEPNLEEFLAGKYERGTDNAPRHTPAHPPERPSRTHRPTQDRKTPHRTMISPRPKRARAGRRFLRISGVGRALGEGRPVYG